MEDARRGLAASLDGQETRAIIFAVRQPGVDGHWYANFGYYAADVNHKCYRAGGGRLCRLDLATGEVETFKGKEEQAVETEPVDITTEDYGCVMIHFVGGARGCLWVSQVTAGRKNCLRYELAGSRCALEWRSEQPNDLWIGHRDRPNETLMRDPALVSDAARAAIAYPGGHNEGFPDTFKNCFQAFYGYIAAGDFAAPPTYPTFEDGHREIVLCEAILNSHQERRWVELKGGTA